MSTYTRSTYNVYKDGVLIGEKMRPIDAAKLVQCDQNYVPQFAKRRLIYHGYDADYIFEVAETIIFEKSDKPLKSITIEDKKIEMPDEWITGWENARTAFKALQIGCGELVTKDGKKFTEIAI